MQGAVCEQALHGSQEGRCLQTSGEPETTEQVCHKEAVQDGECSHAQRPAQGRGLDDINRPQGCVPLSPDPRDTQKAPPFSVEGDTVRVPVPPIWPQQRPTHIHQALEASDGTAEKAGYQMCHFCGRSAPHGLVQVRADGGNPGGNNDVSAVGLPDQLGEISSDPVPAHQVSGVHGRFIGNDSDTPRGEAGEDHPGLLESPEPTSPDSEIPRKADREDVCCHSGDPASSSVLPGVAEPEECSFQEVAVVRLGGVAEPGCQARPPMVDKGGEEMEWEEDSNRNTRSCDRLRRLSSGATSSLATGGLWSPTERLSHINLLELTAGAFAVKTFTKGKPDPLQVRLRMDNTTAVAYLNHMGGTQSQTLAAYAKQLWLWCLNPGITLSAEYRGLQVGCHLQNAK